MRVLRVCVCHVGCDFELACVREETGRGGGVGVRMLARARRAGGGQGDRGLCRVCLGTSRVRSTRVPRRVGWPGGLVAAFVEHPGARRGDHVCGGVLVSAIADAVVSAVWPRPHGERTHGRRGRRGVCRPSCNLGGRVRFSSSLCTLVTLPGRVWSRRATGVKRLELLGPTFSQAQSEIACGVFCPAAAPRKVQQPCRWKAASR